MRRTRKFLKQEDIQLPKTWWQAQMERKGQARETLTDDERKDLIKERARCLDDKVGNEISAEANVYWEGWRGCWRSG